MMNKQLIEALEWRYACKKFDAEKHISTADLDTILYSIQLTPSSYGLQPIKVLLIESKELREQIKPIAWNQAQVVDASHLLVFCHYTAITPAAVDQHVELMAHTRNLPLEKLQGFGTHVKSSIANMNADHVTQWTGKQTYIALGQLLLSCALLKIDATPMEGFDREALDKLLDLSKDGLSASLLCPIGYRHAEDPYIALKKVRKTKETLFETR
jgi:nitroreductase